MIELEIILDDIRIISNRIQQYRKQGLDSAVIAYKQLLRAKVDEYQELKDRSQ